MSANQESTGESLSIHGAKTKEQIYGIQGTDLNVDVLDNDGNTPLLNQIRRGNSECVIALLVLGANPNFTSKIKQCPLQLAIEKCNVSFLHALIVFGADVYINHEEGLLHLAGYQSRNREKMQYILSRSGAQRCGRDVEGCSANCGYDGESTWSGCTTLGVSQTKTNVTGVDGKICHLSTGWDAVTQGDTLLCMDGGGIRGLIMIQFLIEIEKCLKRLNPQKRLRDWFDWIGGTSTGGLIAAGMVYKDQSMLDIRKMFFELKDNVFKGTRPYNADVFETLLRRKFGETVLMNARDNKASKIPKLVIPAALADKLPPQLHLFRNYTPVPETSDQHGSSDTRTSDRFSHKHPSEQEVWKVVRATTAGPTYFSAAFDEFLDGGLISNNPTTEVLTERLNYYNSNRDLVEPRVSLVLSLGTGHVNPRQISPINITWKDTSIFNLPKAIGHIIEWFRGEGTRRDGLPVDRALAWSSATNAAFYRLDPLLTNEPELDSSSDTEIIRMMWETTCYLTDHPEIIQNVVHLLMQAKDNNSSSTCTVL